MDNKRIQSQVVKNKNISPVRKLRTLSSSCMRYSHQENKFSDLINIVRRIHNQKQRKSINRQKRKFDTLETKYELNPDFVNGKSNQMVIKTGRHF